ncbi:uncharacterized protein LOC111050325, partial [Nilaparvata lugens]|uniref:uncharacterized protein LOC111050325 n=1 Tax=Nilaparvata lugens TaxID=108931 RepID=UPI00193E42A3
MDEVTSFSILKKCSIIPKAIKSIICSTSRNFLFVWSSQEVYVYEYKLAIVDGLPELNGYEETFNFGNNIVAVISSEENVYALDEKGSVFLFNLDAKSSNSPDDIDIFEASPEEEANRQQSLIGSLDKCDELLAVMEVAGGFASCSKCKQKLIVQIWRVHPLLERIAEHSITDTSPCQ